MISAIEIGRESSLGVRAEKLYGGVTNDLLNTDLDRLDGEKVDDG